jgi:maltose alpha-D-glucosyltransferase / alpha-amylase
MDDPRGQGALPRRGLPVGGVHPAEDDARLAKAGFTQSYTYFTWRNTKDELIEYLTELTQGMGKEYFRPNFFTNTPDILPVFLQEGGRPAFRIRLALAGTLSPCYGIYNGFELCENAAIPGREEYIHSEKYEYKVWDWDRPGHIKRDIAWYKDAIIYQLHVKAFFDANDDGIGDFAGLTRARLPRRISASRRCGCCRSIPRRCATTATTSPTTRTSSDYGTMARFPRFVREAHRAGCASSPSWSSTTPPISTPGSSAPAARPRLAARNWYVWSDTDQKYPARASSSRHREIELDLGPGRAGLLLAPLLQPPAGPQLRQSARVLDGAAVMRFWLDIGVDGLRLDAVPYLIEREGTNNENLPETHDHAAHPRRARPALPEPHAARRGQQWPEDVQQYFGDGDECHMAFHFPLMPRMYMAVAQEDRFPITDIMRQTPDIPENCQWAIFLRNHDELTLEMVTDASATICGRPMPPTARAHQSRHPPPPRAADGARPPQDRADERPAAVDARHAGDLLRRRDRHGRQHLSRRPRRRAHADAVVADRNGGFSRADPASAMLPPIMDPVYGFQAVNVEAQSAPVLAAELDQAADARARKRTRPRPRHAAVALSGNRKVLAYLREWEGETMLCVANLSRSAQAVELDNRQLLEREVIPSFMPRQRWFGAKDQRLLSVLVLAHGEIAALASEASDARPGSYLIQIVEAALAGGEHQIYHLPLAAVWSPAGSEQRQSLLPATLAELRQSRREGGLVDALSQEGFVLALVDAIQQQASVPVRGGGGAGEIRFRQTALFDPAAVPERLVTRRLGAEQSNSSVLFEEYAVLKVYRRLQPGPHPEIEMGRFLVERAGFANTPSLLGTIELALSGDPEAESGAEGEGAGTVAALGVLFSFVRNQGDGWTLALEHLLRYLDDASNEAAPGATPPGRDADMPDPDHFFLALARQLGLRTAQMHRALAEHGDEDPDFAPEPITREDVADWRRELEQSAGDMLARLERSRAGLPEAVVEVVDAVLAARAALFETIRILAPDDIVAVKTRHHGDYHLGQVIAVQNDFFIIDFEGEPARPIAQRRNKSSPLRDVAGMIRSFDYAAITAVRQVAEIRPATLPRVAELADAWRQRAVAGFRAAYRRETRGSPIYPANKLQGKALIDFFTLEKAVYEVNYELANRPGWVAIPLNGILRVLAKAGTHE